MFAFTWLFGLGFWIIYVLCGLVFTLVYTKIFTPKIHNFIKGDLKKKDGVWYNGEQRTFDFDMSDMYLVVAVSFLFWPAILFALCVVGLLLLIWKSVFKLLFYALKNIAVKIPDISIKKQKTKETL